MKATICLAVFILFAISNSESRKTAHNGINRKCKAKLVEQYSNEGCGCFCQKIRGEVGYPKLCDQFPGLKRLASCVYCRHVWHCGKKPVKPIGE